MITTIFDKITKDIQLEYNDIITMLNIELGSEAYYMLLRFADSYARKTFHETGVIFGQIGLDAAPCSANCQFCLFAAERFDPICSTQMSEQALFAHVRQLIDAGTDELFLMTTASYDQQALLRVGEKVRQWIPEAMRLVVNTGDFDEAYAYKLKQAGFTGVYHICRLREGIDTALDVTDRIRTLEAINKVGLALYYCVEPIGPEHTDEEIADEIVRAVAYNVEVMAVMRRICFEGSGLQYKGQITSQRLALICAVTTLYVRPRRAMGVHEPDILSLIAGANQIYAESGTNPRDTTLYTENGRGLSVKSAKRMLHDAGWECE